ncbi:MAG: hypothetical protein MJE68_05365, partial [Proteobacteria bacterium]|nr:hypothetical protein [Pseudomonadota bacterium]
MIAAISVGDKLNTTPSTFSPSPTKVDLLRNKNETLNNFRNEKHENVILSPVKPMTLEQAINFIREDEMVEVTPKS